MTEDTQIDSTGASGTPSEPVATVGQVTTGRQNLIIALLLLACSLGIYSRACFNDFVNFDDSDYVYDNAHLKEPVTSETLIWAFTSGYPDNWFPLTRLSHLADYKVFGPAATGHHIVNVVIHALAAVLLFFFLLRATDARWPSAVVAFLFALHPLHVESVAWVSERKDVLCAFFWFCTCWAWLKYGLRPDRERYLFALLFCALGLMSKPMMVTMPVVLLLLDFWPLRRPLTVKLLIEKIPFAALSVGDAVATIAVQHSIGAVATLREYPIMLRLENALLATVFYIRDFFWPARLGVLYTYPASIPFWQAALAALALLAVSVFAIRQRHVRPWFAAGWFWYLVTLLPVIGIVQVGLQSRADRYTYIPMVGISVIIVWGGAELLRRWPAAKPWTAGLAVAAALVLSALTWHQISYWSSAEALFERSVEVDPRNHIAIEYLGGAYVEHKSKLGDAISKYERAIQLRPDFAQAHNGLGVAFFRLGMTTEAMAEYRKSIALNAWYADAYFDLGSALLSQDKVAEAVVELQHAIQINTKFAEAYSELGVALLRLPGRESEGVAQLAKAVKIKPNMVTALNNLGAELTKDPKSYVEGIEHLRHAIRLSPRYIEARVNLGVALLHDRRAVPEAIRMLEGVLRVRPDPVLRRQLDRIEDAERSQAIPGATPN